MCCACSVSRSSRLRACWVLCLFLFKQKTAYELRISDWSSDGCSSDLGSAHTRRAGVNTLVTRGGDDRYFFGYPARFISRSVLECAEARRSEERRVGKECVST